VYKSIRVGGVFTSERGSAFLRANKRLSCEFDTRLSTEIYKRREKERKRNDEREGRAKKLGKK
jgi:hypothetical protein